MKKKESEKRKRIREEKESRREKEEGCKLGSTNEPSGKRIRKRIYSCRKNVEKIRFREKQIGKTRKFQHFFSH